MRLSSHNDVLRAINLLFRAYREQGIKCLDIDRIAGVSMRTMFYWRGGRDPKLSNFIYFAESAGYEVHLHKKADPPADFIRMKTQLC